MPTLIYIHGFLSSPDSHKARQTRDWLTREKPDIRYLCPRLSPYPLDTQRQLEAALQGCSDDRVGLIGSSLGGFWSTYLVERFGFRAVLINPSVRPDLLVERVKGQPQKSFHSDDVYLFTEQHATAFQQICPAKLRDPSLYWLLVQTGDETLDYRQAVARYSDCRMLVEPGGDHSFQGFANRIPQIVDFLFAR